MPDFQYAYLVGSLAFGAIFWLPIYVWRKNLRHEMLVVSLMCAPVGPLSEYFYRYDYWRPELFNGWSAGFEDVLFAFFIGGVAAVAYEAVFQNTKHIVRGYPRRFWLYAVVPLSIVWHGVGVFALGINSMHASIVLFLVAGAYIVYKRPDLLRGALLGGVLVAFVGLIFYLGWIGAYPGIIERWWLLENISGIFIQGIPLEELAWGFSWGFVAGPMYEFITGTRYAVTKLQK
ncbi:MAG: lycopene cyclase domain-containing protein [Patescibacteria group bacterium]